MMILVEVILTLMTMTLMKKS